jgi:hypothetical protein
MDWQALSALSKKHAAIGSLVRWLGDSLSAGMPAVR